MANRILRLAPAAVLLLAAPLACAQVGFRDAFTDPALPGWERHCSAGNALIARDGRRRIHARTHTFAHLSRPGAHQLRLPRCMIAEEMGEELRLLPAIPRAWLAAPEGISVKGIATFFGDVALSAACEPTRRDVIRARVQLATRAPGRRIVLRLPHPDGLRLVAATVNDRPAEVKGESVVFAWCDHAEVTATHGR